MSSPAPTPPPARPDHSADAGLQTEVLAVLRRSDFIESIHHGIAVGLDPSGEVRMARGDVSAPIFPRSSNKPMQAAAMVRAGLDLPPELLALASASHSGEDFHLDGAGRILEMVDLPVSALQNTPDRPSDPAERQRWIEQGRQPTSLAQNCSGKHAAMLATCVINGWDLDSYRDPQHPLQRLMADTLAELSGESVAAIGVDGCGAPVMAISTLGLARAFAAIALADPSSPEGTVADAIRTHPAWLGGTDRDVTRLIEGVPGLISKDGAEAVQAVALPDGTAIAIKIADGAQRARPVVVAAALRAMGLTGHDEALEAIATMPVLGHGAPVGSVEPWGW